MKIAVIDPWSFTPPYNRELCEALASVGHEVTLIGQNQAESDGRNLDSERAFSTLGLFTAPSARLPRSLALIAKGVRHIQGLLRTVRTLRHMQPDIIHVQWLPLPLVDVVFVPLLRRVAPVVLTIHDSNPYHGAGPLLLRFGNMLATRRFDRWIVHNELSERRVSERGLPQARIHRIAHGLLSQPTETPEKTMERADARVHFLQFGKLKEYKGADVLLNALGRLDTDQRQRCRVSIVGRPYLETEPLVDLVTKHQLESVVDLRFDFVSDAEMARLFDDADVLVFPYRGIDTSGVLMAAIAKTIPVVASNIGCFSEMLIDGDEGRLVVPDDPEALAAVLADLIDNPGKVHAMRAKMAALQKRIPSWQQIAEETTQVYQLAQTPPASRPIGAHTGPKQAGWKTE